MTTPDAEPNEPSPAPAPEPPAGILDPYTEPPAPTPAPEAADAPPRTGWTLTALIPDAGREPSAGLTDAEAQAVWCAVTALWHPSLLARAAAVPRIESITAPTSPGRDELRLVVHGLLDRLPSGYATQAEDAGAVLLESSPGRDRTVRELQTRLDLAVPESALPDDSARDFLALGLVRWMVRDLASAMGRPDAINEEALARETLAAADAWVGGDSGAVAGRLKAAFEILTQARESVYSVDAYLVDICLLDPALPAGSIAAMLETKLAITFLAPAAAIEAQATLDPEAAAALNQAITDGWADVIGGTYAEAEDPLLPIESTLWQFRRGGEVYRDHLDDRNVETYARRRSGLWPQVPQLGRRHGYRFAVHVALDGGRFPVRREPKRLWESPEGSSLETLFRPPIAADRPSQGLMFPWKLAATMRIDHVATLPLIHWPAPVASWYLDLRRAATHSPVFGRWATLNDYFQLTDRPYETFRPEPDEYASPYLAQAVAARDPAPISRFARHHRLRARIESASWLRALAKAVAASRPDAAAESIAVDQSPIDEAEAALETRRYDEADPALDALETEWSGALARSIAAEARPDARPGYLVFNPLGVARKLAVMLPDASPDLRPEGALIAAQLTDEGVAAVVDLPAFGFAWIPRDTDLERPAAEPGKVSASGNVLKNETVEVEFDPDSGGLRGVLAIGESTARLALQVVMTGVGRPVDGKPAVARMKREKFEVEFAGPALVQAVSTSVLIHPTRGNTLARIVLRCRLWTGRPIVELDLGVRDLDSTWVGHAAGADPWEHHLACRWAWPDATSTIRRLAFLAPETTAAERPETPDAIDVSTRRQRTAMVFGGLPYHKKVGGRMLDTLLVAGSETGRDFRLAIVLDDEHPHQAAQDFLAPAPVVATDTGPPPIGDRGWLMRTDSRSVAVTHVGFLPETFDGRGWGLDVHLVETTGYHARCRLQFFRNPTWARQYDFQGETQGDLSVEGDAVWLDLMAGELYRVVVAFG
ncbi:glycosyl hydrolase family 38 [Paludisphaera mucosa]|uniref:Glycosyl hydrolase family 38 n=1 Tax=Paludisphaera mucosa TaxID=3030827 RepID=A0ABT6F5B7_9BACT|nr:glycosyl hydrolase family 38 [Paludisphaera mucosa]MDG3002717.1 glycosyl hydrolase family 38 [Paludisphaera mucosa]